MYLLGLGIFLMIVTGNKTACKICLGVVIAIEIYTAIAY